MKKLVYLFAFLFLLSACSEGEIGSEKDAISESEMGLSDGSYAGKGGSGGGDTPGTGNNPEIQAGQITAGEWSDLKNWNFWSNLGQKEDFSKMPEHWSYNLNNRISVHLKNNSGTKLVNVPVKLVNSKNEVLWESVTDNIGNAELWPSLKSDKNTEVSDLKIVVNNQQFSNLKDFSQGVNELKVNTTSNASGKKIDIAFMVDATGSMGDELEYLKVELIDIIKSVKQKNASATINMGTVFYRDIGDDYVTKKSGFSSDIDKTVNFIKQQSAAGGGDFPEAVHTALKETLKDLQWSTNAMSRVVFMVLDAPPHHETQIISEMNELIAFASQKGIKLIPVVASGIDKETEFLMRYTAIATNGTYVFITNHSGIGNDHLEPTIGEYEVEFLNDLLVRLIDGYLK